MRGTKMRSSIGSHKLIIKESGDCVQMQYNISSHRSYYKTNTNLYRKWCASGENV